MMNIQDIRSVAKDFGIKIGGMSKLKLIHSIQISEGNFNCFASATSAECDQMLCKWREDCFAAAKKMHS